MTRPPVGPYPKDPNMTLPDLSVPKLVVLQQTKSKHTVSFAVHGAPMFTQNERRFRGMKVLPQTLLVEARSDLESGWRLHHVTMIGVTPDGEPAALTLRTGKGEMRVLPNWAISSVNEVLELLRANDGRED
ncbi:hypothetical protein E3_1710 [Rhodococcus phage E3]|uniref:hypothetical protein n=1 Tax=Rhodococcus phage E3 TaxID=1007869 RepID=UPI0002C69E08|nr:hypothetical protein M176_gp180 [Rhodococcus phage E3]AEQ21088.1 hypothetical protein E3_1710 [Rhodococcus phage E3]